MKTIKKLPSSPTRKIRVLSLDGGGIKGVLPAMILTYMEEALQEKTGNPDARISDYFDFLAGTSTGGLLTCALLAPDPLNPTRPKLRAKEACDIYLEQGGEIFNSSLLRRVSSMFGFFEEKYNHKTLERILRNTIGENVLLSKLVKPCMITAYDLVNRKASFLTRENAKKTKSRDFLAWQVARATSAAPTYFEPIRMKSESGDQYTLIDGGVFANNPAMCAFIEVKKMIQFRINGYIPSVDDMVIVSISTGSKKKSYSYSEMKTRGKVGWLRPIVDILMDGSTNTADHQLQKMFEEVHLTGKNKNYYRIDPSLENASIKMDDASKKNLRLLMNAGKNNVEKYKSELDEIVLKLIENHTVQETQNLDVKLAS